MSSVSFATLSAVCLALGCAALWKLRRTRCEDKRLRCAKLALGSFGSLVVLFGVQMLVDLLPILVVAFAVAWIARRLSMRTSMIVRFVDKQFAKMS
jgi:hypothetical protein